MNNLEANHSHLSSFMLSDTNANEAWFIAPCINQCNLFQHSAELVYFDVVKHIDQSLQFICLSRCFWPPRPA